VRLSIAQLHRPATLFVACLLLALCLAGTAAASHNRITLVSTGPTGGNAPAEPCYWQACAAFSEDGSRVFFNTDEQLVPADTDNRADTYMRAGATTTLISIGPSGGNGAFPTLFGAISADGTVAFFHTAESLVPADTDGYVDLYRWSGGSLTLVSTGPSGGNGRYDVCYIVQSTCFTPGLRHASRDGSRVAFSTEERLVPEDTDSVSDVYLWAAGTVTLVANTPGTAEGSYSSRFRGMSEDGAHVIFDTAEQLVPGTDGNGALYERVGATVSVVTDADITFGNPRISADGSHVYFGTPDALDPTDTDNHLCADPYNPIPCNDVYVKHAGTTTLVSARPDGTGGCCDDAYLVGLSHDGTRAFFATGEKLVGEDDDGQCGRAWYDDNDEPFEYSVPCVDVYERSADTTKLVSTSSAIPDGTFDASFVGLSSDGSRAFVGTAEPLLADDANAAYDIYERTANVTTRVSVGPTGSGATGSVKAVSRDGGRVIFDSFADLVQADGDGGGIDTYERANGRTTLLTAGPPHNLPMTYMASTPAGDHVLFVTQRALDAADTDSCPHDPYPPQPCADLYDVSIGPPVGYPRPRGATVFRVPLVPASRECTSPNSTHGPPLAFGSCSPPAPESPNLTLGIGDGNPVPAKSIGSVRAGVLTGAPGGTDDSDVRFTFSLTNVMRSADLSDYTGELRASVGVRLTDSDPGAPAFNPPATTADFPFAFTVPCTPTADSTRGGDCVLETTAEGILPGVIQEGARAIWGLEDLRVFDGGPDGDAGTDDNSLLARQGVFVP
jgi:hypothetical protein